MTTFAVTNDATFAAALLAAADGDTINMAAGTYTGDYDINKDLTINGAKVGVVGDAIGRGFGGTESVLSGAITISGAGVTMDGVEITGSDDFGGALTGAETGVWITGTGASLQNTLFDGGGVGNVGLTLGGSATGVDVGHSAFTGYGAGMYAVISSTGSVHNNSFYDGGAIAGSEGIVTESTAVLISANTFYNGAGAGAGVFAVPTGSANVSSYVLGDNILSSLPGGSHIVNIDVSGLGSISVTGTAFDDAIYTADDPSHAGNLTYSALGGNDEMWGGAGNDTMDGGAGDDIMHGQGGTDTVSYLSATAGVTVTLANQVGAQTTVGAGADFIDGFTNLTGSGFDDTLTGDGSANLIVGGAGIDNISGGIGTDELRGGDGNDTIHGNDDADVARGGAGTDSLFGDAGNDILDGGDGDDSIDGGATGNDTAGYLTATAGVSVNLAKLTPQDTLGAGIDTLANIDNLIGSNHNDTLKGDAVDNVLSGMIGQDRLFGQDGADTLFGGNGNDRFSGGNGDDVLIGGNGDDNMRSGAGDDDFNFGVGFGNDVIKDFDGSDDDLIFDAALGSIGVVQVGNLGTLCYDGAGDSVFLQGFLGSVTILTGACPADTDSYI